jgi:Tat protein secretion system quality control protein TatD with DNase activity
MYVPTPPQRALIRNERRKEAMKHPRCVGLGEIGLDYHYTHSPQEVQQSVLRRQLQLAIECGKPLTIHTREAEEDTEAILKEVVPRDWKVRPTLFAPNRLANWLLDPRPLFHRQSRVCTTSLGPLPESLHRNHRSAPLLIT